MFIYLPILVMILGGIIYYVADSKPKLAEIGRIAFFCGLFFTLWMFGGKA